MPTDDQGNASMELACGLAEEVVREFGEVHLRVFGTSMVPSILPGDLVSIRRACLQDIIPGEVILFLQNGRLFVHRVVDRKINVSTDCADETFLITRGDRLRRNDPPVSSRELLGRLVSIERDHRKVQLISRRSDSLMVRLLQSSDRLTYLYLRLAAGWRSLFLRRTGCQA